MLVEQELNKQKQTDTKQNTSFFSARSSLFSISIVIILMLYIAAWQFFLPASDPARYQCYALTFWSGSQATHLLPAGQCAFLKISSPQPAFHLLPREYPPLTLLPFSLALLVPLHYYQVAFALLMALTTLFIYWLLQRYGPHGGSFIFAIYLLIGACALALMRYDLLPTLCTLLCVVAAERKRWTVAYLALAIGVLLKIYPILLLPALFIAEQQTNQRFHIPPKSFTLPEFPRHIWDTLRGSTKWQWKNCLLFLLCLLSVTSLFAAFNFEGAVTSQIYYFLVRPFQVEASISTLLWIGHLFHMPWQIVYTYGSVNIQSNLNQLVSPLGTGGLVLGFLYVTWLQWRNRLDLIQAVVALLLLFIVTGKVFSPQYLIWIIPVLAYAGAFNTFWLISWGCLSIMTTFIYAYFYSQLPNAIDGQLITLPAGFFEMVSIRNILFVLLTLAYLFNWFQARQRKSLLQISTVVREQNTSEVEQIVL